MRCLSVLPHFYYFCSTIYLYQYGLIDIYFRLWVIIQCYFRFVQIVPDLAVGSSFCWLLYPFDIPLPLWNVWFSFFEHFPNSRHLFLTFWFKLYISCPCYRISHFPKAYNELIITKDCLQFKTHLWFLLTEYCFYYKYFLLFNYQVNMPLLSTICCQNVRWNPGTIYNGFFLPIKVYEYFLMTLSKEKKRFIWYDFLLNTGFVASMTKKDKRRKCHNLKISLLK